MNILINIKEDFSMYPGLRHCNLSDNSGEHFYHSLLNKTFKEAYDTNTILTVVLDGTDGYAPSFIDEAFGNLVYDFSLEEVKKHINIVSIEEPIWKDAIEKDTFIKWEDRRKGNMNPKVTLNHAPWYRLVNNTLELKQWSKPMN